MAVDMAVFFAAKEMVMTNNDMPGEIIAGDSEGYPMWRTADNEYLILDGEAKYIRADLVMPAHHDEWGRAVKPTLIDPTAEYDLRAFGVSFERIDSNSNRARIDPAEVFAYPTDNLRFCRERIVELLAENEDLRRKIGEYQTRIALQAERIGEQSEEITRLKQRIAEQNKEVEAEGVDLDKVEMRREIERYRAALRIVKEEQDAMRAYYKEHYNAPDFMNHVDEALQEREE